VAQNARQAIRDYRVYIPGQAVAFIGPVGCGKTFVQTDVITPALGGRAVDPSDILINKAAFNAAMWAGEHLVLGDEELRESWASHASLMPTVKKLVAAKLWPFKKKYGQEIASLRPVWRLTVSANDDPRSLRVVPAPEESFGEKIAYLKAYSPPREFHDGSPEGRAVWAARLAAAIPAFLRRVDAFEIPEHKRDTRFAIETFHHPEIVELVGRNMPESAFGEALTDWITNVLDVLEVRGSAAELHRRVCRDVPSFSGLCKNPHTFGVNLGSLARAAKWKDCVKKTTRRVGGREKNLEETVWTISVAGKTAEAAAADGEPKEENDNPF
jgi:Family of unknown function (DUF5906)